MNVSTKGHNPNLTVKEIITKNLSEKIKKGYEFAHNAHKGRLRFSGKPYIHHSTETANILLSWLSLNHIDPFIEDLVVAALLHDTIEYENVSPKKIKDEFGIKVQELVLGVSDFRSNGNNEVEEENLRLIARKGHLNPLVFVIKLADRLHNMRTHKYLPLEKQIPKARETLNVYVPLAENMGMWKIKRELEDLCFKYLDNKNYLSTIEGLSTDSRWNSAFDKKITTKLQSVLRRQFPDLEIYVDPNGLWHSFYKKISAQSKGNESSIGLRNINDIKTVTILASENDIQVPYLLMSVIHTSAKFSSYVNVGSIRDYIARPLPNKFSALLSTIELPEGPIEICFTTRNKKDFNDLGIISLIRKGQNLDEYKRNIVFDENHHAWFLPVGSTYLDFVYHIGVGPYASYVMVSGAKKQSLDKVTNGSIIKIKLSDKKLKIPSNKIKAVMPETLHKINRQSNLLERDNYIIKGKKMIEEILRPRGLLDLNDLTSTRNKVIHSLLLEDTNELSFRVGIGNIKLESVNEILDRYKINKNILGLSTLRVSGKNKPGILKATTDTINKFGGNIFHIASPKPLERKDDYFTLRILFKNVIDNNLVKLKKDLINKRIFSKVDLV